MMKTRIKTFSKRSLSMVLTIMMVVTMLFVGSVTSANALYSISNNYCRIYFDNTVTGWSSVNFCIRWNSGWMEFKPMTHITGTNLWVWASGSNGSDVDCFAFAQNKWNDQNSTYDNLKGWNLASAKITANFEGGYAYMYSATSTATYNNGTGTAASLASRLSARWDAWADSYKDDTFKTTHHLKVKTKAKGASSYSNNSTGNVATMKFKDGYYLYDNYDSANCGDGTTSTTDATFGTVKSGYFKLNYSNKSDLYSFDGWGASSGVVSGYGSSATSNQFTNVNSAQTYYGYFSEITHSVTFANNVNSTTSSKTAGGVTTTASGSASSITGYTFQNKWVVSGGSVTVSGTTYNDGDTINSSTFNFTTSDDGVTITAQYAQTNYTISAVDGTGTDDSMYNFSGTTTAHYNTQQTFTVTAKAGYQIDSVTAKNASTNASIILSGPDSNGVYTITAARMPAANVTVTITASVSVLPQHTTPTLTKSWSSSVTASPSGNVTITVSNNSTIQNADSGTVTYTLLKDGVALTSGTDYTYSNGVFTLAKKYSLAGNYTVTANATSEHSASDESSSVTLTITRTALSAPTTVTLSSNDIVSGSDITITAVGNTSIANSYYNYYYYVSTGSLSVTDAYKMSENTPKTISNVTTNGIKYRVIAEPTSTGSEYYTRSTYKESSSVAVYSCAYKICGDGNGFTTQNSWSDYSNATAFDTYEGSGVFSHEATLSTGVDYYFKLINSSNGQYSLNSGTSSDFTPTIDTWYDVVSNSSKSLKLSVTTAGKYAFEYDAVNNKARIVQHFYTTTATRRYQSYNLSTGSYNDPVADNTGGTVSSSAATVNKGDSVTFTATPASGYFFDGWYTSTTFTSGNKVSSSASYTFTPTANTKYYGLFKQNEPAKKTITVSAVSNATLSVTWNNQTVTASGGTLTNVPVGATVNVSLTPNTGYELNTASGVTLSGSGTLTGSITVSNNATITITTKQIDYTVTQTSNHPDGANAILVTLKNGDGTDKTILHYNDQFNVVFNDYTANGYTLSSTSVKLTASPYTALTPSGNYYTMPAGAITVTATYVATTPDISTINSVAVSNHAYSVSVYAGQSATFTPSTGTSYENKVSYAKGGTNSSLVSVSGKVFTFNTPLNIGSTAGSTASYSFTITPTNSPSSGFSMSGTSVTVTINVSYSATQQAYMNLKSTYDTYTGYGITDNDVSEGWSAYDSAMSTAGTAIGTFPNDLPVWNASDTYTAKNTALENAYNALVFKTNTIYVLSKYSSDVKLHTYNRSGFFSTDATLSSTGNDGGKGFAMTLEGTTNSGKYLYSMTYQGKCDFIVYKVSGSTIVATANKLSDNITLATTTTSSNIAYNTTTGKYVYGEYYLDLKDKSTGNTDFGLSSVTEFADFGDSCISATGASGDDDMVGQCEEGDEGYSVSTLTSKLGVSYSGASLVTSSQTVNTTFSITGPARGESSTVTVDSTHNWVPTKPGRYTVVVNASLGTDERDSEGATFTGTKSTVGNTSTVLSLFVAYDDIEIYADMNGNVGTPTIHFTYTDNQGNDADLPYEFDMVTGSESIYSYTISVSTLADVYDLDLLSDEVTLGGQTYTGLKIDHISIDNVNIDNSSFVIERSAARTGTLWLKADSSHMKTFNKIAYGSSTRTFKAVLRTTENNATTDTDFNNTFAEVNGTGIITDGLVGDSYQYSSFYAAKDTTANYNFSYTLRVKAETDITHKDGDNTTYYFFDHWERINGNTTTTTGLSEANGADVNILSAPNYDTDADVTYVAVYKLTSTQKRVQITYKFKDYDTDDENYVFDETLNAQGTDYLNVKDATYTKTVNWDGTTALATVAQNNMPIIKSNYFDYTFDAETANVTTTQAEDNNTKKTCIEATLKHTPHKYKIIDSSNNVYKGYYQQTKTLTSNYTNPLWYIKDANNNEIPIGTGTTYKARFGIYQNSATDIEGGVSYNYDTYTIYVKNSASSAYSSIAPAHQETYYDQDTPKARHNFYIIDAMGSTSGEFVGAGVLYATTDSSGNYRQTNAGTVLGNNNSDNKISNYITGILNPNNNINTAKYGTEFKAQTINNIGFRYLPYSGNESIIRYSNELSAYMYTFAGENTNSSSLNGQKLRVFSFFVYKNGNAYTNVVSSMYAEVDRYIAPPDPNPNS